VVGAATLQLSNLIQVAVATRAVIPAATVDNSSQTLSLQLGSDVINVITDNRTRFDDDTDAVEKLTLSDINPGDFLEVEAYADGETLVATRIDRDERDEDDEIELQGPTDDFNPNVDITVLGLTYDVTGASFEGLGGESVSSEAFFTQLSVGDLVKLKIDPATPGVAQEVEFEDSEGLDGADNFDDDDSSDDSSDDDERRGIGHITKP